MNRTIAILAAIVVVIAVWYFGFRSQPEVVPEATTTTETAPATTTETTAAPAGDIAALLDPATFDADKLIAAVDTSTLDDATKTTLKTAIEGARNNPGAVQAVIDQVKAAMGM